MESTCPNCKKKNEHEDYLFEVACTCGSRYNPFMALEETPAAPAAEPEPKFAEANDAFADIRSFGDANVSPAAVPAPETEGFTDLSAPAPAGSAPAAPLPSVSTAPRPATGSGGFAAGPAMEPLPPTSACVDFDGSLPNPLAPLIDQLWQQAAAAGGSACTELRWAFSPDGQKLFGSCVPVRRA